MRHFPFVVILALLLTASAFPQTRMGGKAVQLIDGKTVVVELPTGRVNVELQYIDVPEPGEQMYKSVYDHLQYLILGKNVSFRLGGFVGSRMTGELQVDGVDISRQMLRDGAAWHLPGARSGQDATGFALYAESESAARNEKRGIWSVPDLKAPWIIRDEKLAERVKAFEQKHSSLAQVEKTADDVAPATAKPKLPPMDVTKQISHDAWLDVSLSQEKRSHGLHPFSGKVEGVDVGVITTSAEPLYLYSRNMRQKVACRAVYATATKADGKEESIAILGFQAISDDIKLVKVKNSLSIYADGQRIAISDLVGIFKHEYFGIDERFAYSITKRDFARLASAKNVEVRIDDLKGKFAPGSMALFKQLAEAMQ